MRFDWEPRPTPEGLLQIYRNQKRDASDQNLKEFTTQYSSDKCRAQWEESSQRKAQLVAQTLLQEEQTVIKNQNADNPSTEPLPRNVSVADAIRQESEEKHARRTAERELAAQRREASLKQAAAIAAAKESKRQALAQENRLAALKERDPELLEYMRKLQSKELVAEWQQQQQEITTQEENFTRRESAIKHGGDDDELRSSLLLPGGKLRAEPSKEKLLTDLKLQLEEFQRRKAEERSKTAAMEAELQRQWQLKNEAAHREEQEKIKSQREFLESVEIARTWEVKQASKRAMAEEGAEKRLLAAIQERQRQDTAKDLKQKMEQREDAARELKELRHIKETLRAENKAAKRLERLRLGQEAEKHAEFLKEESRRRQNRAQEIFKANQALVEAERTKKHALMEDNINLRSEMDENAEQSNIEKAASKQAQRAEAVLLSSQLAAQIAARKVKGEAQRALEKTRQDKEKILEEERKRLIAETIAAYKILR